MFNNELWQKPAGGAGGAGFYTHQIANSCRFIRADASKLSRALGTATANTKWTFSSWVKPSSFPTGTTDQRGIFGATGSTYGLGLVLSCPVANEPQLLFLDYPSGASGPNAGGVQTLVYLKRLFRDPNAWYHIVVNQDTTQSTASDRIKFYINGELQTDFDNHTSGGSPTPFYPSQNSATINDSIHTFLIGVDDADNSGASWDGYMAETYFIDGTAYAASDFGESKNGVWIPKDASGLTFGNNGFYLKYESSSNLGNDSSGNNNDYTVSNISAHDQMLDSPTFNSDSNGGNFATYNPLNAGSYATLSEGNLKVLGNTSSDIAMPSGTFAMTSGKWYFERLIANESSGYPYLGLAAIGNVAYNTNTGGDIWAMRFAPAAGTVAANGTAANVAGFGTITATSTGLATATTGDIIGFHLDLDNRKCWLTKNGAFVNSGDPSAGTNPQWSWTATPNNPISFIDQIYNGTGSILNAGQDGTFAGNKTAQGNSDDTGYGNFYYAPDTGFLAMCSGNLPVADAVDPAQTDDNYPQKLFEALNYTGTGSSGSITTKFQPDFIWMKNRGTTKRHYLVDSNRGINSTSPYLHSDQSVSEGTGNSTGVSGVSSTSISFGGGLDYVNASSNTYVSWHWRANGGGSSNSDGATSSTVQADPSGAFSIVTYTGISGSSGSSTVGHGMGVVPQLIFHKARNASGGWWTQFAFSTNANYFLELNGTRAQTELAAGTYGAMSRPTTSVFSINGVDGVGGESRNYIAYCFANIEGYCKVGSYIGNGNADGSFVYCGFRPAFILLKDYGGLGDWVMYDNKTEGYNVTTIALAANLSNANQTSNRDVDIFSNGFKFRISNDNVNGSSKNYVFLAMAHNPFKYATAR